MQISVPCRGRTCPDNNNFSPGALTRNSCKSPESNATEFISVRAPFRRGPFSWGRAGALTPDPKKNSVEIYLGKSPENNLKIICQSVRVLMAIREKSKSVALIGRPLLRNSLLGTHIVDWSHWTIP